VSLNQKNKKSKNSTRMTKRHLLYTVCGVVAILFLYAVLGGVIYFLPRKSPKGRDYYAIYKDTMAPLVVIAAAYLGFAFQRRHSYLQALRELWKSLIPAVQRAIQYTYRDDPDPKEFSEVMHELSTMIDSLRGVFKNIPDDLAALYRDDPGPDRFSQLKRELSTMTIQSRQIFNSSPSDKVGLYPYEPLKDIKLTMKWLREHSTPDDRYRARRCIRQEWFRMHSAMLKEFDREIPILPISKYLKGEKSIVDKLIAGTLNDKEDFHD
jgi:hypothetical protein